MGVGLGPLLEQRVEASVEASPFFPFLEWVVSGQGYELQNLPSFVM